MPNPTLNWRAVAPVTLAANTTVGILDALYTAGTAATYVDGSTRTPGTGSAWTWNRDTGGGVNVASYGAPPTNALSMQYIVAGATTLPGSGPTMIATGGDTNAINRLNIGMVKNAGAYAGWNLAAPFTTGQFSGYANVSPATTTVTYATLYYWECEEAFVCQLFIAAGTQGYPFGGGAFLDPLSASGGESDGRTYSIMSNGNTGSMSTSWITTLASIAPWNGDTAANSSRFWQFNPGTNTVVAAKRLATGISTTTLVSPGGEFPSVPHFHFYVLTTGQYLGVLREVALTRAARTGQRWDNGGTTVGYILSSQTGADQQACALLY